MRTRSIKSSVLRILWLRHRISAHRRHAAFAKFGRPWWQRPITFRCALTISSTGGRCSIPTVSSKVADAELVRRGVVVGFQTRQGKVGLSRPRSEAEARDSADVDDAATWADEDEKVQGIVLLRKGQESKAALRDVRAKIDELNQPGHLLPGVKIEPYYDRYRPDQSDYGDRASRTCWLGWRW